MLRAFEPHEIRKTRELSGKLWDLTPREGEQAGKTRKVFVPGCWETCPGLENYRGTAVYETEFFGEGNVRLEFKGVSHFAKVYVDGEFWGEHYGSYTPFFLYQRDLPKGLHRLSVEVDNSFSKDYALDFPNDYYSYGGISRGVSLEAVSDVVVEWIHVTPLQEQEGRWTVQAETACRNLSSQSQCVKLHLRLAGKVEDSEMLTLEAGETVVSKMLFTVDQITPWNMETPALYEVSAVLWQNGKPVDDLKDRFGFRLVTVEEDQVLLNGRKLRIKGVCRHEDHPLYGCALPAAAIMEDLMILKDAGANSVRTVHYPNDELFLDFCDELGILVWEENHARGLSEEQMKNPHFEEQCEQVIREMITHHYNHPSIYIWGILNECSSDTTYGRSCYEAQYQLIQELDSSRPYSSASCKFYRDICQDLPKVCAWNMYPYWYNPDTARERLENLSRWLEENGNGGKPLLVTEVGAGAVYGFRSTAKEIWSEERQKEILQKQLTEIAGYESCMGMYIWQFCDVRVAEEWAMERPKTRNNKGIVDEYRRPKLAFEAVKEIFRSLPDYR